MLYIMEVHFITLHYFIFFCTPPGRRNFDAKDLFFFVCQSSFLCVCLSLAEEAFMCKTQAIADVVILVDGSWSIGRINFRLVRTFLESLVRAFDVDFDKTRIGEQALRTG